MPASTRNESGSLCIGGVELAVLVRDARVGTPTYVYDVDGVVREVRTLEEPFGDAKHLVAYAVKANSAGPIVRALASEGAGADVVSGAELALAVACGIAPDKIVFSGVAKSDAELDLAIQSGPHGIGAVQIESVEEIARVEARAEALGRQARVSLRVNPAASMDALETHAHIATGHDEAKFGVPLADIAWALARLRACRRVELVGFTVHIGSQFTTTDAYAAAARALFGVVRAARGEHAKLAFVDTGGGFGVDYGEGCPASPADFVRAAIAEQRAARLDDLALYVEPGRSLVAAHGVLVASVLLAKQSPPHPARASRRWLMIDAGMNDLLRPALYQARHRVVPLERLAAPPVPWRVVGPVCESSDDFGVHELSDPPPEAVAILDSGAYGYTMASRYNGRPLPAEVFIRGGIVSAVSQRRAGDEWVRERSEIEIVAPHDGRPAPVSSPPRPRPA